MLTKTLNKRKELTDIVDRLKREEEEEEEEEEEKKKKKKGKRKELTDIVDRLKRGRKQVSYQVNSGALFIFITAKSNH